MQSVLRTNHKWEFWKDNVSVVEAEKRIDGAKSRCAQAGVNSNASEAGARIMTQAWFVIPSFFSSLLSFPPP